MHKLRDQMLAAPEFFDPERLPARFSEAQDLLRKAIAKAECTGITDDTLAATLISEAMPRLVAAYGPAHAARIIAMFAACLTAGAPSNDHLQ
ncbi:hypothetical protein [Pseudolabrys sp. FHR47]|uniref:hypothetical protein n=1 Tax=Pseudolabrys sp. FHR47 TaxID=2562284 RepID=UPI0010BE9344|nr:hypothetical protein [Pseudolabrys sp. FHR47]